MIITTEDYIKMSKPIELLKEINQLIEFRDEDARIKFELRKKLENIKELLNDNHFYSSEYILRHKIRDELERK